MGLSPGLAMGYGGHAKPGETSGDSNHGSLVTDRNRTWTETDGKQKLLEWNRLLAALSSSLQQEKATPLLVARAVIHDFP